MPIYSVIIRNALVFDGTGSPPEKTDIGIEGDKISFTGDLSREESIEEIDASGLYAAPAFIDITNHSDTHWTLFDLSSQESLLRQGVATIIGGSCGTSLAPISDPSDLERLRKWGDFAQVNINWQSAEEFFTELSRHKFALNFASLTGHATLRLASKMDVSVPAEGENLQKLIYLLNASLKSGAMGLSTGLGRGVASGANDHELHELLSVVKKAGKLATHHLEDEGADIISAGSRIAGLSRASGVRSHLSHFKVLGAKSWSKQKTILDIIERARGEGIELTLDFFPYLSTGSAMESLLPDWALEGPRSETIRRLKDQEMKKKIAESLKTLTLHYEKIVIASTLKDIGVAGKSLKNLSADAGMAPEEFMLDLLLANDLQVSIFNEIISEENMQELARKEYAAFSSDGFGLGAENQKNNLAHPRSFGAFPRALNYFVKEKGILKWEEAIRKMTGLPAEILGLDRRGLIKKGFFSDIVVFDPEAVKDEADYKMPNRFSSGVRRLFINGRTVLLNGDLTAEVPGRILTK